MTESGPFPLEDFLASLVEALKIKGDARAITAIVEGDCRFDYVEMDFGIEYWSLHIMLPVHIFYALSDEDRQAISAVIAEGGSPFFMSTASAALRSVEISPGVVPAEETWRSDAVRFIRGEGVTNQGRVRSDNVASKQHQGLLFRSKAEITLFQAMLRARLAVAPLPVFVRIGKSYHRLEPDFIVVYKGLTFVVEVDGDGFHKESPADAEKRLVPLTYEGVEVWRIRASDLESEDMANLAVKQLIAFMASRKEAR